ncbi:hypothetical protein GDO86_008216 [Hymenochirus boettgeri]|uniref:Uncharacterized protein n=1 Tax=Hymenochirus boettgeri TaxID=247094 RepID=A0A8T2J258_9PIPI|nr:hypothetical protein GDO86_008216 [Hymenochirus boettgeri]
MAKIHPETKVLIIKRLKTKSTADVAHTFNVSQHQVQRIKKRFEETGEVFDKPREVLQGAQLIAVASADPTTGVVDGSPLQANDIQVQYVQLAPVTEPSATAQAVEPLQSALQPEMHIEHGAIQIQ